MAIQGSPIQSPKPTSTSLSLSDCGGHKCPKMFFQIKTLVLSCTSLMVWMVLKMLIVDTGISLLFFVIILGAFSYLKVPKLQDEMISDNILGIFDFDENDEKRNIIYHKGGASYAPENTIEAIQQAAAHGIRSVEIDLDFTKDGVGVVIHGPLVDDTTDGTGFVSDYTFDEIQKLNAAAKDANRSLFPKVQIPSLEALLKECIDKDLVVFLDCKSHAAKTAELVCRLFKTYPVLYSKVVVCSFYPTIIYKVRRSDPKIVTALTHRNHILSLLGDDSERNKELWKRMTCQVADSFLAWAHWSFIWYICGNSLVLLSKDCISLDIKKFWFSLGIRTVAWTVNDPLEQSYQLHLKVPIITDGLVLGGPGSEDLASENRSSYQEKQD